MSLKAIRDRESDVIYLRVAGPVIKHPEVTRGEGGREKRQRADRKKEREVLL